MAKSPEETLDSMINNLKEKTGKSLDEWVKVTGATKLTKHGEIVKYLKSEHEIGHGYANLIAQKTLEHGQAPPGDEDLVEAQYAGQKAALRPIYNTIIEAVTKFGKDVAVSPKKAYVSLRRNKQFALIQPSTATRVDIGINLKGTPPTDRLEASGSFNAMVSHRVRVETPKNIDKELIGWLKDAYQNA